MLNFAQIWEGHKNHLFPNEKIKDFILETSKQRLEICNACPSKKKGDLYDKCGECGCPLVQKSKCLSCKCPLSKWLEVASPEQNSELHKKLNYEI